MVKTGLAFDLWFRLHIELVSAELTGDSDAAEAARLALGDGYHEATVKRLKATVDNDTRAYYGMCRRFGAAVPELGNALPFA